jgi:hypothetical protein
MTAGGYYQPNRSLSSRYARRAAGRDRPADRDSNCALILGTMRDGSDNYSIASSARHTGQVESSPDASTFFLGPLHPHSGHKIGSSPDTRDS